MPANVADRCAVNDPTALHVFILAAPALNSDNENKTLWYY